MLILSYLRRDSDKRKVTKREKNNKKYSQLYRIDTIQGVKQTVWKRQVKTENAMKKVYSVV